MTLKERAKEIDVLLAQLIKDLETPYCRPIDNKEIQTKDLSITK